MRVVDVETETHLPVRQFCAKAVGWKHFIIVILLKFHKNVSKVSKYDYLYNIANGTYSVCILIAGVLRVEIMKRIGVAWVPVRPGIVNGDDEIKLSPKM